jgi:hypothetical protein
MKFFATVLILCSLAFAQTTPANPQTGTAPKKAAPAAKRNSEVILHRSEPTTTAAEPDDGSLNGSEYTSDYFGFSYDLPEGLAAQDDFMQGRTDSSKQAFVLLAAFGPAQGGRKGVVIMADKAFGEAKDAAAYLAKVTHDYAQGGDFEVLQDAREYMFGGRKFYRADYKKDATYQTAVFTVDKGYALGFNFAAPSSEDMELLVDSLRTLKFAQQKTAQPRPVK